MENESAVTSDAGTAPAESNPTPSVGTESTQPSQSASNNPGRSYTDADVQNIIRERLNKQKSGYEKRLAEFEKRQKDYEQMTQRLNHGFEAFGRGLGFIQDQPEQPLTRQELQQHLAQLREEQRSNFRQMEQARLYNKIQNDWSSVTAKHAEWSEMPGFKDAWAKAWDPTKDPMAVASEIVSAYEKVYAARQNKVSGNKEAALKTAPVKGGSASASVGKDQDDNQPLRKKLAARLAAARG